jgi:pyrroline-5-carboxylate reductase
MNFYLKTKKIGFIGSGNMTRSLIIGLKFNKNIILDNIFVCNRTSEKAEAMSKTLGINFAEHADLILETCDIVVISIKPQDLKEFLESYGKSFTEDQIVLSLCAGVKLEALHEHLPQVKNIARLMPSTTCEFGKGVLGIFSDNEAVASELEEYFESVGAVYAVDDEDSLDSIMISAASGVGFILEFMQIWSEWLEEEGFDQESASEITKLSFAGVSAMLENSDKRFSKLQSEVTSKKGVTLAGLEMMRSMGLDDVLNKSFAAARRRSKEMEDLI